MNAPIRILCRMEFRFHQYFAKAHVHVYIVAKHDHMRNKLDGVYEHMQESYEKEKREGGREGARERVRERGSKEESLHTYNIMLRV